MNSYTVRAHARLACCLLDMNGERGRADGTLGIALETPFVEVSAAASSEPDIVVDDAVSAAVSAGLDLAERVAGRSLSVAIRLPYWIPAHVGLGHKTQTVLAVAVASLSASSVAFTNEEVAQLSGRGGTSGAGIHTFLGGGVVLDGGHRFGVGFKSSFAPSAATAQFGPPPLVARIHPPHRLRIVVASATGLEGASGVSEVDYFERAFPTSRADADSLIANVYMRLVPAMLEGDLAQIDAGVQSIQLSDFKQKIWASQPRSIRLAGEALQAAGITVGLSSMGSTMYTITSDVHAVHVSELYREVLEGLGIDARLYITEIARSGAKVFQNSGLEASGRM